MRESILRKIEKKDLFRVVEEIYEIRWYKPLPSSIPIAPPREKIGYA